VELRAERQESRLPGMATPVQSAADDIKLLRDKINSELARAEMPPRAAAPAAAAPKSFSSLFRAPQPVARPAPLRQPQAVRAAPAPESLRLRPRVAEVTEYAPVEPAPDRGLLSPQSANAAASAFGRLSESSLSRDAVESSFEQMTREMLQPMLRHWLDTHLPSIVERLVREEIERVARRGR
ncbi:MAG: DUF2497 domain-containing protein, partial [Aestuariivirgaceae bacterium]|nr:DUF2497 domain-containing protein [Aestuariivirgaceae bacterium]